MSTILWPEPIVGCWPPYIITQIAKGAMEAAADEIAFARPLSVEDARRVLDVRVKRAVTLGFLTTGEAQEVNALVDGDSRDRPAAGTPISAVTIIQHAIADAGLRDSESHPVTTALAAVGGGLIGGLLGGPAGAVVGFIVGAEVASHDL